MSNDSQPVAQIHVEDVGGEFGFRLHWSVLPLWANVIAYEVSSRSGETALFLKKPELRNGEAETADATDAEPYLAASVKWDGCCDFEFGETHFCGVGDLIKHFALMKHIYIRAGELSGHNHAESPWPRRPQP